MGRRMVFERVRPLGWAGALARGLAEAAHRLDPGYRPEDPYVCGAGHITTRLTHRQAVHLFEARRLPVCRARRCGRPMLRCPITPEFEATVRAALADAAERVEPSPEALERIRSRITQTHDAPRQDTRETTS